MEVIADENGKIALEFVIADSVKVFPLTNAFQIHACNEFLRDLTADTDIEVKFETYKQYGNLIEDIAKYLKNDNDGMNEVDPDNAEQDENVLAAKLLATAFWNQFEKEPLFPFIGDKDSQKDRIWNLVINAVSYGFIQGTDAV